VNHSPLLFFPLFSSLTPLNMILLFSFPPFSDDNTTTQKLVVVVHQSASSVVAAEFTLPFKAAPPVEVVALVR